MFRTLNWHGLKYCGCGFGKGRVQPGENGRRGSLSSYLNHISHFVISNIPAFSTTVGSRFRAVFGNVKVANQILHKLRSDWSVTDAKNDELPFFF